MLSTIQCWFLELRGSDQLILIVCGYALVVMGFAVRDLYFPNFTLRRRKRNDDSENQMRGLGL